MRETIKAVEHYLGLEKPVKMLIKPKLKCGALGLYWEIHKGGKLHSHLIHLSLVYNKYRDLECLAVHELIHAWQAENGFKDVHGDSFELKARELENVFGIMNLYLPDTDK